MGMNDGKIAQNLTDHFDTSQYGIRFVYTHEPVVTILSVCGSTASVKRLRKKFGYLGTAQQGHTPESIAPFIQEIRQRFPTMGARSMVVTLRQDHRVKVSEYEPLTLFCGQFAFSNGAFYGPDQKNGCRISSQDRARCCEGAQGEAVQEETILGRRSYGSDYHGPA